MSSKKITMKHPIISTWSTYHRLFSSKDEDYDTTPLVVPEIVLEENPEAASSRETQQSAYRTAGIVYGAATLDHWSKLGKASSFSNAMLTSTTGAANILACIASYTLWSATKNSRLTSDTYKRLNLSLIMYSILMVISGFSSWKVASPLVYIASSTLAAHTYAAVVCFGGYFKGARGLAPGSSDLTTESTKNLVTGELITGTKFTINTVASSFKSLATLPYALGAVASSLMILHDAVITVALANRASLTALKLMKRSASAGVSSLFFGVLVTLADATKRGRLNGKTFVYLNAGTAFASLVVGGATALGGSLGGRGASTLLLAVSVGLSSAKNAYIHWPKNA